jgi:Terminase large subunit, T4likevirus-type, N-terminal
LSHEELFGKDAIGLCLRRERTQLVELIERAKVLFLPLGYFYRDVDKVFTGPKGGRLRFAYLENDSDAEAYQGHSLTRIYIEEGTTFPDESPINKLQATLRSGAGVPCQLKLTCNPGGPGHGWVRARYRLDTAPAGMEVFRFSWTNPFNGNVIEKTRVFIPSKVSDNKFLDDSYVASLHQVGSAEFVRAWLEGDWSIVQGAFFDSWSTRNICWPFEVPKNWLRFRSMDWGSAKPFSVGWWAVATEPHPACFDGLEFRIPRGALVRYREYYGASSPNVGLRLTVEQVARDIIEKSKGEIFAYTVIDPSMFAASGGPSLAERMANEGLADIRPADNKRVPHAGAMGGWDAMRSRIRGDGDTPMLFVFSTCKDFIRTIPGLTHDPDRPEDLDTSAEDHVADECRYACMSRPWANKIIEKGSGRFDPSGREIPKFKPFKTLHTMTWSEFHKATGTELGRPGKPKWNGRV